MWRSGSGRLSKSEKHIGAGGWWADNLFEAADSGDVWAHPRISCVCVCLRACVCERGRQGHTTAAFVQTHTSFITVCHATLFPFGLELMVKLRTLLTVFNLVLKAKARDYEKGRYISDAACGVRPITMHWVSWQIRADFACRKEGLCRKLTLSHVRSHRCDQSWLVPEAYDHTGVIRTFSASRHQLLNPNLLSCFGWRGARSDALSICHIITTIQCFQPYNAYFRLQTFKHA